MNTPSLQFSGVAHIVRPKVASYGQESIDYYRGLERAKATAHNPNETIREWRQSFPFDYRHDESIMVWGKDLETVSDVEDWDFNLAYARATGLIKEEAGTMECDANKHGGNLSVGRTRTNARAAIYKHPEG